MDNYQYPDVRHAAEVLPLVRSTLREINSCLDLHISDQPDPFSRLAYNVLDAQARPIAKLTLSVALSLGWTIPEGRTSLREEITEQLNISNC